MIVMGSSKFAKNALFSSPNKLMDISHSHEFNELCGFTRDEISNKFKLYLDELAEKNFNISRNMLHLHFQD